MDKLNNLLICYADYFSFDVSEARHPLVLFSEAPSPKSLKRWLLLRPLVGTGFPKNA